MENKLILKFFADFIEQELGIVYAEVNYYQLEHRLKDIAIQLGFEDLNALHRVAINGIHGQMKSLLLDIATNNETSFFRDPSIFKALSEVMIPEIAKKGVSTINLWSAASSSGQEIYSIIMEVDQARAIAHLPRLEIFASDVSERILKKAEEGTYTQLEVQRGLSAKMMIQYFDKNDQDQWTFKPHLKAGITFRKINLLHDWGLIGPFDIIFCRNVLIYQSVENKIKIIKELHKRLNPGGYLVLGAAESLLGLSQDFDQGMHGTAVFYRKKDI